ncbi:MAG: riboflavin synthase, partial [Rickettsiales bacterium]|nr:riboflavin synthase [Rickettsiales bacterium]
IGDSHKLTIVIPKKYKGYVAEKGSISINGVSLTVNEVNGNLFSVNLIPHTWEFTTMKDLKENDKVHFEIDILVRYALKLAKTGQFNDLLKQMSS